MALLLVGLTFFFSASDIVAATLVVTNTNDSGPGSLRQAINDVENGETITFDSSLSGTITLTNGELTINKSLTIEGPGPDVLAVSRSTATGIADFRIFTLGRRIPPTVVTISGLTISHGRSFQGGGISNSSSLAISNCRFIDNVATAGNGGALYSSAPSLTMTDCIISDNTAMDGLGVTRGGGIFVEGNAGEPPTIMRCTISNNTAIGQNGGINGGGGATGGGIAGSAEVIQCTITDNSVQPGSGFFPGASFGGGADLFSSHIENSTISHNSATTLGGGLYDSVGPDPEGTPFPTRLESTIIAKNEAPAGPDIAIYGLTSDSHHNLIGNGDGGSQGVNNGENGNLVGNTANPIDPLLGPLAENGGPTFTRLLLENSPALDAGSADGLTTDQRGEGFPRTVDLPAIPNADDGTDIGAAEGVGVAAAVADLLNISTRLQVLTGDQVLIGGFIITGTDPKMVILRAIGPSLGAFGISDPLADPVLELRAQDGTTIMSNDNWTEQRDEIEATGLAPSDDLEAAIVATLDPGAYTAIMSGNDGGTGVGLVEVYDLDSASDSELANISTRGFVETGNNVMIGGFILGGDTGSSSVLIRAIGPGLTAFGVPDALEDPTLELRDAQGALIRSNNDWMDDQPGEIEATGLAPSDELESAILETLNPGAYTAIVFGADGGTGVGLVEVYRLP